MLEKYRPSGRWGEGALPALVGVAVAAGLVAGGVFAAISSVFNLLVLFPLAMGGIVGGVCAWIIHKRHVRAPFLVAAVAAFAGLLASGIEPGADYVSQRTELIGKLEELAASLREAEAQVDDDAIAAAHDATLVAWAAEKEVSWEELGATLMGQPVALEDGGQAQPLPPASFLEGVVAWWDIRLAAGMTVSSRGRDTEHGATGTLVWTLVEVLCCLLMAVSLAVSAARAPYCETAGAWFPASPYAAFVVGGPKMIPNLKKALLSGSVEDVLAVIRASEADPKAAVTIGLTAVDERAAPHLVTVTVHAQKSANVALRGMLRFDEAKRLVAALERLEPEVEG